jgi:hypothetical protein
MLSGGHNSLQNSGKQMSCAIATSKFKGFILSEANDCILVMLVFVILTFRKTEFS